MAETREEKLAEWKRAYFHWLIPQIDSRERRRATHNDVLMLLHTKEFVWTVPNDDNRVQDGRDLRPEFLREHRAPSIIVLDEPVTVLEVLIALSRRLAFAAGGAAEGWAWQLMINLDLARMNDPLTRRKVDRTDEILEALIWRTYNPDGSGGFFPLSWPEEDQTKVELWYQMSAYVNEIHPDY